MIDGETFSKFLKATDEFGEFFNFVDPSANRWLRNCHQNSYLINRFLPHIRQPVRWVNGLYRCDEGGKDIHHSWIAVYDNGDPAIIYEYDPRQLRNGGGYENDLMPGNETVGLAIDFPGAAVIVDPDKAPVPHEVGRPHWLVISKEIFDRFERDTRRTPKFSANELNAIDALSTEASWLLRRLQENAP